MLYCSKTFLTSHFLWNAFSPRIQSVPDSFYSRNCSYLAYLRSSMNFCPALIVLCYKVCINCCTYFWVRKEKIGWDRIRTSASLSSSLVFPCVGDISSLEFLLEMWIFWSFLWEFRLESFQKVRAERARLKKFISLALWGRNILKCVRWSCFLAWPIHCFLALSYLDLISKRALCVLSGIPYLLSCHSHRIVTLLLLQLMSQPDHTHLKECFLSLDLKA